MNCLIFHGLTAAALAAGLCVASAALAQERSVLDRVFGNNPPTAAQDVAQGSSAELVLRIERLEQQNRELTGTVEQLQFRNRQLESQIRSLGAIPGVPSAASGPAVPPQPTRPTAQVAPVPAAPLPPASIPGRRSDVFDPTQNPNAPGVPRPLGTMAAQPPPIVAP